MFWRDEPNHILHLLLSVVTFGAWLFVWMGLLVGSFFTKWHCSQCGHHAR